MFWKTVYGTLEFVCLAMWLYSPVVLSQQARWISTPGELSICQCCNVYMNWNFDNPLESDMRGISWQHLGSDPQTDTLIMSKAGAAKSVEIFGQYRTRIEYVPNAGMTLHDIQKDDAGRYRCTVVISEKSLISNTATLKVIPQPSGKNVTLTAKLQNEQVLLIGSGPPDNFNVTSYLLKNDVRIGEEMSGPPDALCHTAVPVTDEDRKSGKLLNFTCCLEKPAYARLCPCDCVAMCGSVIVDLSAGTKLGSTHIILIVLVVALLLLAIIIVVCVVKCRDKDSDHRRHSGIEAEQPLNDRQLSKT